MQVTEIHYNSEIFLIRREGQRLIGHTLSSHTRYQTAGITASCAVACLQTPDCVAFNLYVGPAGDSPTVCELANNTSPSITEWYWTAASGWNYYGKHLQ